MPRGARSFSPLEAEGMLPILDLIHTSSGTWILISTGTMLAWHPFVGNSPFYTAAQKSLWYVDNRRAIREVDEHDAETFDVEG